MIRKELSWRFRARTMGIKAANALVTDGARVQISGVFAPHQALLAAAIGASYVAPTFGKMYDAGRDGFKGTEEMMKTITKCGSESKVLVKNVRSAVDVANLGSIGCDTFAISAEVCEDMFSDSLTTQYDKELNFTVARIGEKQRELKIEAKNKNFSKWRSNRCRSKTTRNPKVEKMTRNPQERRHEEHQQQ